MDRRIAGPAARVVAMIVAGCLLLPAGALPGPVNGTIWIANRGTHVIRGFDADTGAIVHTVAMAPNSQPGDLAAAKGKLYVAEEFGTPPAVAVVDAGSGTILGRITFPAGARPHHVHASAGGNLIAVGLYGTDLVAVIDARTDLLVGVWDSDPAATAARIHAAAFSNDEHTLYLASDTTGEVIAMDTRTGVVLWRLAVPSAHEVAVTHDQRLLVVSRRTANRLAVVRLAADAAQVPPAYEDVLVLDRPDTLRFSANEALLTVGLRGTPGPARLAVVDTRTGAVEIVTIAPPGDAATLGGHQWTAPNGRYTVATYEGGATPGLAVIDHAAGNQVVWTIGEPGRPHGVVHTRP
jgi:DNA-binding beta-propeller fold protein YncE